MPANFAAKALTARQAAQAYPLIQSIAPSLSLAQWTGFVNGLIGPDARKHPLQAGIMTVQNDRGYIHGLFSYIVETDLCHGRVLATENFVALDLVEREEAVLALLDAMEEIAVDLDCQAIHVHMPQTAGSLANGRQRIFRIFEEAGHRVETVRMCKHIVPLV